MTEEPISLALELDDESKKTIENTESTVGSIYDDVTELGDVVDLTKVTTEQLAKEFRKFRKEHEHFKWEMRRLISEEIEKSVQPLKDQLEQFTTDKRQVIFVRLKIPFVDGIRKSLYTSLKDKRIWKWLHFNSPKKI